MDHSLLISIGSTVLFVGIAWGHSQAQIRSLKERIDEMREEKASLEKLEGFEERIGDKLEALEKRIEEMREDLQFLKKNS
jgi:predicted nuclease with TOPRIM domain